MIRSFTDPKQAAFSFEVLYIIIQLPSILGAVGLFSSDMLFILTWFGHDFPAGQFLSVCSILYRGNDTKF